MGLEQMKKRIPVLPGLLHEGKTPEDTSYLIGSKCGHCGRIFSPRRFICCVCMRDDTMEETPLSTRGTIDTFTVVHVAPVGFEAPYIQGFVDLPEGPRIFSLITGCEPSEEAIEEGAEVELVIDKISEDEKGNDLIGYKFRPVGRANESKSQ